MFKNEKTIIVKLIVATLLVCASVTALTACFDAGNGGDYSIEPIHTYEMIVVDEYLVSEATCTQRAVYYYSCACGKKRNRHV